MLYALALPLVTAQKAGVTLAGLVRATGSLEGNLMARSILMMTARVCTLALFALAYSVGLSQDKLLVAMTASALALLPLEYWTARRLQRPSPPFPEHLKDQAR